METLQISSHGHVISLIKFISLTLLIEKNSFHDHDDAGDDGAGDDDADDATSDSSH